MLKLSEIDRKNSLMTNRLLDAIVYGGIYDNGENAEIAVVAGNLLMYRDRVETAVALLRKKRVEKILLTGGIGWIPHFTKEYLRPEAHTMREYAIKELDVNERDIIIEDKSKDTFSNVKNSLRILDKMFGLSGLKLALVTNDFHLKRYSSVYTKMNPDNPSPVLVGATNGYTDRGKWMYNSNGQKIINAEAGYLISWANAGRITDTEIDIDEQEIQLKKRK